MFLKKPKQFSSYLLLYLSHAGVSQECPPSPSASNCSWGTSCMADPDEPLDNIVVLDDEAGKQYVWNSRTLINHEFPQALL